MNGRSIRSICDDIGVKSYREAVERGQKHVEDIGINSDKRQIEIDQLFKNTLAHLTGEMAFPGTAEALARSAEQAR